MLIPKRLKKGDTIGVIAPASPPNLDNVKKAIPFFEQKGLNVKLGPNVSRTYGHLAGTDEERLKDLHDFFQDPNIDGIICAGGGYGTARIADLIDYDLIRNNPKIFWGYSDITFLHTAIRQQTGLTTFHGPMLGSDIGKETFDDQSRAMFDQLFSPQTLNYDESFSPLHMISKGEASGEIVGGNLSLLVTSIGTSFEIDTKGKLLLIEDIGEEPYRIDSFLNQLRQAGKFEDAAGVIVGDFSESDPKKEASLSLDEVLHFYFANLNKPVLSGFKIGHCLPHFAIPFGTKGTLSTPSKTLTIEPGVY
ncbi:LD-carboxypeptidase [Pontibacillus sp. ALD_SL1]|uniref:S66 peptidase family protein n=1 Tax=Pontibacillus sp. ALD_SL1 TaxID=2777185 RepID=UPI001A957A6F|nr:LD-carboxypeptidase [Pontibacillus sp. ALD_SL1]QSS99652.1 LD-carboxypeptidase [Pontibacillus sp. ALD_SL1]